MVLSIFVVVGVDVGFNSNSGQFLIRHFNIDQIAAESGRRGQIQRRRMVSSKLRLTIRLPFSNASSSAST